MLRHWTKKRTGLGPHRVLFRNAQFLRKLKDLLEMPFTTSEKADRFESAPRRLQNLKLPQEMEEILAGYVRRSGFPMHTTR